MTSQPCNGKSFVQTQKKFGHRNGRSSCAHSIGKFFLGYIVLVSFETSATGSPGNYLYNILYIQMLDHPVPALRIRLDSGHHRSKCKSGDRMHRLKRSAYWLPMFWMATTVLESIRWGWELEIDSWWRSHARILRSALWIVGFKGFLGDSLEI